MLRYLTAKDIHDELLADGIIGAIGNITLNLKNISVEVNSRDSIGHMLQDWITNWARSKNIYMRPNPDTQDFPDCYLSNSDEDNLLEIKAFNYDASPAFDVANFETYKRSLLTNPKKLDADYLIFGYTLTDGILKIKGIWLKKIWEICTSSEKWALKLQVKQDTIVNIRPQTFTSTRENIAPPFTNKLSFLEAIQDVLNNYPKTAGQQTDWLDNVKNAYQTATGQVL